MAPLCIDRLKMVPICFVKDNFVVVRRVSIGSGFSDRRTGSGTTAKMITNCAFGVRNRQFR